MKKAKKIKKKGCWRNVLIICLIFLLSGATVLLFNYCNHRNSVDAKFQELVNREFDKTAFADTVSSYRSNFATKLRNVTGVSTVCDSNGKVNFDILLSEDCTLKSDWQLGKLDLATYTTDRNAVSIDGSGLANLRRMLICNQITWTLAGQTCTYEMIYQISGKSLSNFVPLTAVPEYLYLTVEAKIDMTIEDSVVMYNYAINDLTGEDNEYCLNKIFSSFAISATGQKNLAYTPFEYLVELNTLWKSSLIIYADSDAIVFEK